MTPNGFVNGQDESRCYVNASFQVHSFNIYFGQLILDIYWDKIIEEVDDSEYKFSINF